MTMVLADAYTRWGWGAAQNMTFGILIGAFMLMSILILFWMRSGHERARRRQILRHTHARVQRETRLQELEDLEPPPQTGENFPR